MRGPLVHVMRTMGEPPREEREEEAKEEWKTSGTIRISRAHPGPSRTIVYNGPRKIVVPSRDLVQRTEIFFVFFSLHLFSSMTRYVTIDICRFLVNSYLLYLFYFQLRNSWIKKIYIVDRWSIINVSLQTRHDTLVSIDRTTKVVNF